MPPDLSLNSLKEMLLQLQPKNMPLQKAKSMLRSLLRKLQPPLSPFPLPNLQLLKSLISPPLSRASTLSLLLLSASHSLLLSPPLLKLPVSPRLLLLSIRLSKIKLSLIRSTVLWQRPEREIHLMLLMMFLTRLCLITTDLLLSRIRSPVSAVRDPTSSTTVFLSQWI